MAPIKGPNLYSIEAHGNIIKVIWFNTHTHSLSQANGFIINRMLFQNSFDKTKT